MKGNIITHYYSNQNVEITVIVTKKKFAAGYLDTGPNENME